MIPKVRKGQRVAFRAKDWNSIADVVNKIEGKGLAQLDASAVKIPRPPTGSVMAQYDPTAVDPLPMGSVVAFGGMAIDPQTSPDQFRIEPVLACGVFGTTATLSTGDIEYNGKIGVTTKTAAPGEIIPVVVSGAVKCLIQDATGDGGATAEADSPVLVSGSDIQLIWSDPDPIDTLLDPWADATWHWGVALLGAGGSSAPEYTLITMGKGRSISGAGSSPEIFGLRGFSAATIAEVPTLAPTATDYTDGNATWPFGLAAGQIWPSGAYVWVAAITSEGTDVALSIPQGTVGIHRTIVQIPITGGGGATTPVHLTWRV